jgi:diguanylate cyclase (GGDEF)-like protein/PAS domain S-box-containing protein
VHRPRPDYYVAILGDVTELVHREHLLERERDRIRLIVEVVREHAIYSIDRAGMIDSWNASGERLFGLTTSEAIGRCLDEIVSVDQFADVLDAATFAGWRRTEGWAICSPGEAFYTDTMISTLVDETGQPEGFIIVTRDTTEMHRREDDLRHEADTDPLTKLANRRGFDTRADRLLKACAVNDVPASVLMIDIDHFKAVNDTYGHDGGDLVLCAVAAALAAHLRTMDLLARFGGEEFAVLMPGAALGAASRRAEALRAAIAELVVVLAPGVEGSVTISIGVAGHNGSLPEAIQRADVAMYEAKNTGRNRVVCDALPPLS